MAKESNTCRVPNEIAHHNQQGKGNTKSVKEDRGVFSPCTDYTHDQWKNLIFCLMKGAIPVLYLAEIPTLAPMCKCCWARVRKVWFCKLHVESQQHGGLLTCILNNALVVTACQIKGHNTHRFWYIKWINMHWWSRTRQLLVFFNSHVGRERRWKYAAKETVCAIHDATNRRR